MISSNTRQSQYYIKMFDERGEKERGEDAAADEGDDLLIRLINECGFSNIVILEDKKSPVYLNWKRSFFIFFPFPHGFRFFLTWCLAGFCLLSIFSILDWVQYDSAVAHGELIQPHDADPLAWIVIGFNTVSVMGVVYFGLVLANWYWYSQLPTDPQHMPHTVTMQWLLETVLGPYSILALACFELYFVQDISIRDASRAKEIALLVFIQPVVLLGCYEPKWRHALYSTGLLGIHLVLVLAVSGLGGIHVYHGLDIRMAPRASLIVVFKLLAVNGGIHGLILIWQQFRQISLVGGTFLYQKPYTKKPQPHKGDELI